MTKETLTGAELTVGPPGVTAPAASAISVGDFSSIFWVVLDL
jgi:hypothetical protein